MWLISINSSILYMYYNIEKYIKKLLGMPSYILKREYNLICVKTYTHALLEKFNK